MTSITLLIPTPTSTNALHVGEGKAKRRTPEYRTWLQAAGWSVRAALAKAPRKELSPDVWWWSHICLPFADKADADNRVKALHDLLVSLGTVPDDRHLLGHTVARYAPVKKGTALITVTSIPDGIAPVSAPVELRGVVS